MSRVIIVHRWGGDSESDWIPWLREQLELRGVKVVAPDMPNPEDPTMESWVPYLSGVVGDVNEETYFVGHSVGCQAILTYLETLAQGKRIGGVVFVAAWTKKAMMKPNQSAAASSWTETNIDWAAVAAHTSSFTYIYSDNDPYVPTDNAQLFKEKLNVKLVLDENRGHFTESEDITQLPELLDELLLIMGLPVETRPTL